MTGQDASGVTILLSDDADPAYAAAWAGLGTVRDVAVLDSLPADELVLRPLPGALPGPQVLARLSRARADDRPVAARTVPIEPGEPACLLGTAAQLRDGAEPLLAPTAVVHTDVRVAAAGDRAEPRRGPAPGAPVDDGCFLSVVMRTQGTRPQCLEEALLSLAGQTVRSFEVVLTGHRLTPAARAVVEEVVASQPEWLRDRIRLVPVEHGGRSTPLNAGFEEARGEYVAVLDDDDVVLAHWVETFRELASRGPGTTLRAAPMQLQVRAADADGRMWPEPVAPLLLPWPLRFELVDHLVANQTPCLAVAFPTAAVAEHGLRFDEELDTTEDWDFLVRAAAVTGVTDSPEITSVYRWWVDTGSSRHEHASSDWDANRDRVVAGFDALELRLPPGGVRRLQEQARERERAASALAAEHDEQVAGLTQQVTALREQVARLSNRVRKLRRRVRKLRVEPSEPPTAGRRRGPSLRRRSD
ncbi:glycosyltransferase [Nocardioides sp. LHG3406-4]|uniref:glycosyltransferase n=1 Tax=Nocardioides sp. LHG3406-4 TaxID=2804575 RepID=UPI003CEE477C